MKRIQALGEDIASDTHLVTRFAIIKGEDKGPYSNLMFEATDVQKLWGLLREVLYRDEKVGMALSQASMAMCEGEDGWNDYLLLYHFDPSVKLDSLT